MAPVVTNWLTRVLRCGLAAVALASGGWQAQAAGLQIAPVGLSLPTADRAAFFTLSNIGGNAATTQVRIFRWTQNSAGEDVLTPDDGLVVSPPMAQIESGREQQFRVIRTRPAGSEEEAFRLIIDELPLPGAKPAKGVQLLLRYSVPVFLNTVENPPAKLQWRIETGSKGQAVLTVQNTGNAHAQISRMWIDRGKDQATLPVSQGLWAYVLPGKTVRRAVSVPAASLRQGRLIAVVNSREEQPQLQFAGP